METLRLWRRRKGWTQADLAREAGVHLETISGIEGSRHEPRPSTLQKLAGAFGVEVEELFDSPKAPSRPSPEAHKDVTDEESVPPPKGESPLSPEWAHRVDRELFRLKIRTAPSDQLRKLGDALTADFSRVRSPEELREEGPTPDLTRVRAFSLVGDVNEELVRREEEPLQAYNLVVRRTADALSGGPSEATQEEGREHQAG